MRQVSEKNYYLFFLQTYLLIFSTEILRALINPTFVQIFFDHSSPFYQQLASHKLNAIAYGVFMMGGQVSGLVANLILGFLSDRWGRKPVILISIIAILIIGITAIISNKVNLLSLFIVGYIIGHLFYGMFPVIIASVTSNAYQSKRKLIWIGLLQFFTGLAFVLGPTLGGILMSKFNSFFAPYYVIIIVSIILLLITWRYLLAGSHRIERPSIPLYKHIKHMIKLLQSRQIIILTILLLLDQIAWGTYFQFIQPFVKLNLGFSAMDIGYLVSFIGISLMISALILLPLFQKFLTHHTLFIVALLAMFSGIVGLVYLTNTTTLNNYLIVYIMSFAVSFGDVVIFSLLVLYFTSAMPITNQGFIAGLLYTLAQGFGWGVSAILGGYLMMFNLTWVMFFAAITIIICLLFFYICRDSFNN
jgi:MFS family permease